MPALRLILFLVAAFMTFTPPAGADAVEPVVGAMIPELRLPTLTGEQTISLRGLRGKKVLLIQFASW